YEINGKTVFYHFELEHVMENGGNVNVVRFDTLSALLDDYYTHLYRQEIVRQMANDYYQLVERLYAKTERKLTALQSDLKETELKDEYQKYGELLTAYMHDVKPHMESVR